MLPKKRSRYRKRKAAVLLTGIAVLAVAAVFAAGMWKKYQRGLEGREAISSGEIKEERGEEEFVYNDHLSNYLFMGVDTEGEAEDATARNAGQADAIFLLSLNRVTGEINTVSIPRDTMTEIEAFSVGGKSLGMMKNHINLQYAQGDGKHKSCELMKTAVSNLLGGIPIQGYCSLNMDGIPAMTELVGNVEITVPDDSLSEVNPEFTEGARVTLTKDNVEQFLRYRDVQKEQSALVRQERQKTFLEAYMKKAQEQYEENASFMTKLYEGLLPYMVTNMGNDVFVKLLTASEKNAPSVTTIPGEGEQGAYYDEYHVDEAALEELVHQIFYKEGN